MKLGIVSCYFIDNYGSILQSYATQEYLRSREIDCNTVSIEKLKPYLSSKKKLSEGEFVLVHITEALDYDLIGFAVEKAKES